MKLISVIQDDTGAISSMRCVFLMYAICFIGLWIMDSIVQKKMADIPLSNIGLLITLMTGKVSQSISENFSPK